MPTESPLPPATSSPKARVIIVALFLGAVMMVATWFYLTSESAPPVYPDFGEISQVESFDKNVQATPYKSKEGHATVLWLTGKDDPYSPFSEVEQIQNYQPDLQATTYESKGADATVIWLSGWDEALFAATNHISTNRVARKVRSQP
jgi:hypothetical protein